MEQLDRFTERARTAIRLAREEALHLHHDYVGSEHLLLGLLRVGDGVAARVLRTLDVDLRKARVAVTQAAGRGLGPVLGTIQLTTGVKDALAHATEESLRAGRNYIGTEHLLLGVILIPGHQINQVLESLGVTIDKTQVLITDVYRRFEQATSAGSDAEATPPPPDPMDLLNEQALNVMRFATDEARQMCHGHIGVVHLLLGLVREESGAASEILRSAGIRYAELHTAVNFIFGPDDSISPGNLELSPRARTVLQLADQERRRLNAPTIGTGHLLVGIGRTGDSIATGVCQVLGVKLSRVIPAAGQSTDPSSIDQPEEPTNSGNGGGAPPPDDPSGPTLYQDHA
jgi:ATP-dependent Clp protease ATP-binding subunit ClpA